MKVLMIGCFDLYLLPYSKKYIDIFNNNNISFKMIFWNRTNSKYEVNSFYDPFNYQMNTYKGIFSKIKGYIKFRNYLHKYIKENKFDLYIFLTTQATMMFSTNFFKKNKGKYIFDYRDETYERFKLYKFFVEKRINYSYKTVISSPAFKSGFKSSLSDNFILCHNIKDSFKNVVANVKVSNIIKISFWGMVRQVDYYYKIFNIFGNDNRFLISIYGEGYIDEFKKNIDKNKWTNIKIYGKYEQEDIIRFLSNTDVLLNAYSNLSIQKNALTIKMYEGIFSGIPMIVQKGSFMDDYLNSNAVQHFSLDIDNFNFNDAENTKEDLIKFLNTYNSKTTKNIKSKIIADEIYFHKEIENFIGKGRKNA